jgi:hypothetical protein
MAAFRISTFSSPETLESIDTRRLVEFLDPHRTFFQTRGVLLPPLGSSEPPDLQAVVNVFVTPDQHTPNDLIDALYYVDGMATREGMADLIEAAQAKGLALAVADESTPADVAVQVWLQDRDLLERVHSEQFLENPKSFEHYLTDDPETTPLAIPADDVHQQLENSLNDWFEKRKRGRTARVFIYPRDDQAWIMVRHGEPFKREASVVGVEPSSVAYRPLKHDVLVYTPALKELRANAQLKGERKLYREEFGRLLFGGRNYFSSGAKYTLEPLRYDGPNSLICTDVDGIEAITLKELHYHWGGPFAEYEIRKSSDLFAAMASHGQQIPKKPALSRAVFAVKFRGVKRARTVTIKPPITALYVRDNDSELIEVWLKLRGFLNVCDTGPSTGPILVSDGAHSRSCERNGSMAEFAP